MGEARLKIDGKTVALSAAVTTIGRTPDNMVAFSSDSNVSRYHAEIEERAGDHWLIELGSSNGTTVNGERVTAERRLSHGDRIILGGSSEIIFESEVEQPAVASSPAAVPSAASTTVDRFIEKEEAEIRDDTEAVSKGSGKLILIAGAICGLAVIFVAAAALIYFTRGSRCDAKAVITKPEPGETIIEPVDIEVDAENTGCISKAVFLLDGVQIAAVNDEPYTASIDPASYPELADGFEHNLQIVLIDENGEQMVQPGQVLLAFETRKVEKPVTKPEITKADSEPEKPASGKQPSLMDTAQMMQRLAKQFPGNYDVSDKQLVQEVQKRAPEYAQEGFFARAAQYRDAINVAYVREQNLNAAMGFLLAMSRSKFNPTKQGQDEGLWQMSNEFVTANAYNGQCGTETLSDASQSCAAKASAIYMKAIVFGVFDGDVLYSVAAFGRSPQDAGAWKASLPANRTNIGNVLKSPQDRDRLVRFFAAGIVAENPHKFGLTKDRPLSELYRLTM